MRIIEWIKYPWSKESCDWPYFCCEKAKETDVGVWCLPHFQKLPICSEEGCTKAAAPEFGVHEKSRKKLCREHLQDEDPEIADEQRRFFYDIRSPMGETLQNEAPGSRGLISIKHYKRMKRRKENVK